MGKKTRLKFLERNGVKFVSFSIGFGKYSRRGKPLDSTYFLHPFRTRMKLFGEIDAIFSTCKREGSVHLVSNMSLFLDRD